MLSLALFLLIVTITLNECELLLNKLNQRFNKMQRINKKNKYFCESNDTDNFSIFKYININRENIVCDNVFYLTIFDGTKKFIWKAIGQSFD